MVWMWALRARDASRMTKNVGLSKQTEGIVIDGDACRWSRVWRNHDWKFALRGNSLVVQWLGLHAFSAEGPSSSLLGELRSRKPHSVTQKSTFTLLCNHPYHPSLELSHLPKLKLYPHETLTSQPLAPTIYYPSCLCGSDSSRDLP